MNHGTTTAVDLPPPAVPDFTHVDLNPCRAERIRVYLARKLMLRHTYVFNLAIKLAPPTHPWRALATSAQADFRNATHATLRPRGPEGIDVATTDLEDIDARSKRIRSWLWRGAFAYLLFDFLSRHVPGPGDLTGVDDTIRLFERIASVFPL